MNARFGTDTQSYVVFDLDDVLANLRDHLMNMLVRQTGHGIHWNQWHEYELGSVYQTTTERIMGWVLEHRVLESASLEPHAQPAVRTARQLGHRIAVVTARGWHPRGVQLTEEWLVANGLDVDELHLVPAFGDKSNVLRKLGRVAYFVDDHVGHLYPARTLPEVCETLLIDRPWNRKDRQIRRLFGLDEFVELLQAG
ncbi:MAG: hypothetical protein QNJ82_10050 [Gammaproteobacteria bacterium]|nr:hypothetical protein [Gammaproteobacteria bacterium]